MFVCNRGDTIQYHGGLRSRELGQAPMLLVFLTPRQALSSHPRQQMVWLYWLQDRDSMPNWYTINHPTTLHTHNESQWPTAACWWHFALRMYPAGKVAISRHLATSGFPQNYDIARTNTSHLVTCLVQKHHLSGLVHLFRNPQKHFLNYESKYHCTDIKIMLYGFWQSPLEITVA